MNKDRLNTELDGIERSIDFVLNKHLDYFAIAEEYKPIIKEMRKELKQIVRDRILATFAYDILKTDY